MTLMTLVPLSPVWRAHTYTSEIGRPVISVMSGTGTASLSSATSSADPRSCATPGGKEFANYL